MCGLMINYHFYFDGVKTNKTDLLNKIGLRILTFLVIETLSMERES